MDDVLAVMDAAGSERAALVGPLEGGPLATLFAATHPDRVSALVLYATFARATWAPGLRLGAGPPTSATPSMDELRRRTGARAAWPARVAPSKAGRPGLHRVGRAHGAPRRQPGARSAGSSTWSASTDVRDVLPTIRVPTLVMHRREDTFLKVEHSRYLAEQHPGRALRGARGQRQPVLGRRLRGAARRDRGVPHRHAPRARARPGAGHGAVHRHRGLHPARRGDGRPRLALPARAPRRAVPAGDRAPPRPRGQVAPATACWPPSTGPRARSAAPPRSASRWARWASRSARACTPASWRCWTTTWAAWRCTSAPG